jgi:hypothetical protein
MQRKRNIFRKIFFPGRQSPAIEEGTDVVQPLADDIHVHVTQNDVTSCHGIQARRHTIFHFSTNSRELTTGNDAESWDISTENHTSGLTGSSGNDEWFEVENNALQSKPKSAFRPWPKRVESMKMFKSLVLLIRLALIMCITYFFANCITVLGRPLFRIVCTRPWNIMLGLQIVLLLMAIMIFTCTRKDKLDYSNYCKES